MEPALAIFAKLLGTCAVATLPSGAQDKHCFSGLYGDAHVEDRHTVSVAGKPEYEGLSIYSENDQGLTFIYVNSAGGAGTGTASVQSGAMSYTMQMRADTQTALQSFSGTWVFREDGYDVEVPGQPTRRYTIVR